MVRVLVSVESRQKMGKTLTRGHLQHPRIASKLGLNLGIETKDALALVQSPLWCREERPS